LTTIALLATLSEWLGVIAVTMILTLSQRFKKPPVGFVYPRREAIISFLLAGLILILSFSFYSGAISPAITNPGSALDILYQRVFLAGISLIPFLLALAIRRQPLRSVGWGRALLMPAFQLGLALAILTIFLRGKIYSLLNGISSSEINALLACLGLCIAEESIFRGYLQLRLSYWIGQKYGWMVTALLYTILQIPRLITNPLALPINLLLVLAQGLILGWVMKKSGNVLAPILYRTISEWISFIT
jgi:membrane protease YdiL (CAAX protease family)